MINSRNLNDLLPPVKLKVERFMGMCVANNIDLLITSTYRDIESQNALYAQGRTAPGSIVTNAKGGDSFHNYKCAVDVVPLINGKPDWVGSHPIWTRLGELGKEAGLEWAGEWKTFKELAHFQYTGGLSLADLKSGAQIR
jgi:peptidoglycan L-alanyl-D-glutamate endopeptidase CwlK